MADEGNCESTSKKIPGKSSDYIVTLAPEDKKRFKEKLNVSVDSTFESFSNPYEVWDEEKCWSDSPLLWPNLHYGDLYSYLVETPGPFNREKLKCVMSLDAFDYFLSRKVGPVFAFVGKPNPSDHVLLKADVRPGQAESHKESHLPWVICKTSGEVINAHCDCKAGWNKVFGNNSLTAPIDEISFKQGKRDEITPREPCPKTSREPLACTWGSEAYMQAYSGFLEELKGICPNACVFKSLPRLDPEETDTANSQSDYSEDDDLDGSADTSAPPASVNFQVVADTVHPCNPTHPVVPAYPPAYPLYGDKIGKYMHLPADASQKVRNYTEVLAVSYEDANKLENETKQQAACPKWYELRYCRLTASNFGKICQKMSSTRCKPQLVARDLLQPTPPNSYLDRMLKWGRENEAIAVQVYKGLSIRNHVAVFECGLFISPEDPFLAATPDRVVYDCNAQEPWGIMEVKCPYVAREMAPLEAAAKVKNFMSKDINGKLVLKTTHSYYFQVQGQMALTGAKWCDFTIYTKRGIAIERIVFDSIFWADAARKLGSFFFKYFLPKYIEIKETAGRL